MCNDGWEQGWHERNGGNLSYRIKPEEVEEIRDCLSEGGEWTPIGTSVPGLAGEYFMVTGSGKYFDLTFGLMHTVEKSAEILVKMLSIRPDKLQTILPQDFRDLAEAFQVTLPEKFLYEKQK